MLSFLKPGCKVMCVDGATVLDSCSGLFPERKKKVIGERARHP